ncbi:MULTISPECIES: YlaN family protein [Brochothrix]|uniref:UPF0358 protein BTBSAS_30079 n=1 Tax=Brochothrix thermosphacta TaxID=2756 RepID=A0A1D2LHW6_BROTH|nr:MULTISPECIES: YlaN family protein [Brochothrix]SLM97019.1 hypothetical protein YlaN [Brachybacterium faecium]ANZ95775.1 hypothetical protein BFC19_10485 [Brochothrix thermosphacta]ANZ98090.1 hypothetical protein BFC20_10435 [Brochothrix thermosphacta]ATF25314.1 hypothetical protein CNY62_02295 [Brochothrix thermosphacta]ATH84697.1 hypothetical protein CPF12_02125 [Brochothrix thermosphacta]
MMNEKEMKRQAYDALKTDANRIWKLIKVQMDNLTLPQCPAYEEVLDTQMYGLSREINFAVRVGLIEADKGRDIMMTLERQLASLHESVTFNK